ncbi:hypothetical protein RSOL_513250 [Rhizoctonia solani AG-3 Rhs1AP]|uniref:Tyrosine kinase domain protein n=2 Tax=Rhizoctonia solani AG-3 TaxID=1086053 RepID=A0A074S0Y7_9AGAM|nr:hypothetical protein RSOL_513250 [Rhizoctonia solani AG-3 Rhs1AP]KEP51215.1 hypothetical protein V565_065520 [Rhizoctonia solani 123E]
MMKKIFLPRLQKHLMYGRWGVFCYRKVQTGIAPYSTKNDRNQAEAYMRRHNGELPAQRTTFSIPNDPIITAIGEIAFDCWIREPQDRPSAQEVFEMLDAVCHQFQSL